MVSIMCVDAVCRRKLLNESKGLFNFRGPEVRKGRRKYQTLGNSIHARVNAKI